MSPTEFSNYIKQRAMQQQQQQQMHHHGVGPVGHHHMPASQLSPQGGSGGPGRSLSPNVLTDPAGFFFPASQYQQQQQHFGGPTNSGGSGSGLSPRGVYDSGSSPFLDMYSSSKSYSSFLDHHTSYYNGSGFGSGAPTPGPISSNGMPSASPSGSAGSAGSAGSGSHSPGVIGGGLGGGLGGLGTSSSSSSALGGGGGLGGLGGLGGVGSAIGSAVGNQSQAEKQLLEGFSNFSLGPHPSNSQYQHLLVAN